MGGFQQRIAVRFTVIFEGESTESHSINAADLAVSLTGLSSVLSHANDLVNGSESQISVKVLGSPKAGSFEFDIVTNIFGSMLICLANTVDVIGLAGKTVETTIGSINTLIELIRKTNGRPVKVLRPIDDDHVEISIEESPNSSVANNCTNSSIVNNSPNTVIVNKLVLNLFGDQPIRRNLEKAIFPLFGEGVASATFTSTGAIPETIIHDEVKAFVSPEPDPISIENNIALFTITRADHLGRPFGWRFRLNSSEGRIDFPAEVLDKIFLDDIAKARVRVSQGTIIQAKYEMVQERKGRVVTKWRIHHVFNVYPPSFIDKPAADFAGLSFDIREFTDSNFQ